MRVDSFVKSAMLGAVAILSVSLPGHASAAAHVEVLGAADQGAMTHFSVYLPLTNRSALKQLLQDQTDKTSPRYRHWLTPAQFKKQFGPRGADVAQAKQMLQAAGFTIVGEHTQNLEVEGPVAAVERMFGTHLQQVKTPEGHIKLNAPGHLNLPRELASMGAVIPQFSEHLAAKVHSHMVRQLTGSDLAAVQARLSSADSVFYPNDLNEAYELPSFQFAPGTGATIGIVMSSVIDPADLANSFNSTLTLNGGGQVIQAYSANSNLPVPTVTIRPVDGGSGAFDPASGAAGEASLDTQMSLGTAPGAKEVLYNTPDLSNASIMDAYTAIVEDNTVDVVSSSFGECELDFTAAYNGGQDFTNLLATLDAVFQQGNAQGITFVASSGDQGAVPCVSAAFANNPANGTSFVRGVSNPASDPNVTAVGGTNLKTTATPSVDDATYSSESANFNPRLPAKFQISATETVTVNNNTWGSGGGFSTIFAEPSYQSLVNTGSKGGRAVPDVSLMMGGCPSDANLAVQNCKALPHSGALIWLGGAPAEVIGTSASAPELAGILALAVEGYGRQGNVNPVIYSLAARQTRAGGVNAPPAEQFFHRNISGNNNGFTVRPGQEYSEVLGTGTLNVKNFLEISQAVPAAGTPNTPSNP
jgi:subtilase family serine protease